MKFKLAIYTSGSKSHYIPESLYKDITDELYTRFLVTPHDCLDKDTAVFDPGGMVMMDEKSIDIAGLITILYSHFEYLYEELCNSPLREVNGKPYYKLHGHWHCIVLTPKQFELCKKYCVDNYKQIKEKEIASNLEFEKRMKEVNKDKEYVVYTKRIKLPEENN